MVFEEGGSRQDERDRRIAELEGMVGRMALELDMAKKVSRYLDSSRSGNGSW
jgi:hypothetical protein